MMLPRSALCWCCSETSAVFPPIDPIAMMLCPSVCVLQRAAAGGGFLCAQAYTAGAEEPSATIGSAHHLLQAQQSAGDFEL
jgi:hypothetical protein